MKIAELILQTNQISETTKFYSDILEFEPISKSENSITFQIGSSKLTFESTQKNKNPKYHFAFNIPVNKLEEAKNWINKKLRLIQSEDNEEIVTFEKWKARAIYFYDNNNNILELICREDLKISSEKEFTSKSIINISEVGIGAENPLQLAETINENFKIEFFVKGPKREDFVALGNEEGLFVISNPNRNWFPTKNTVEIQKLKVKFNENGKEFSKIFND